jgi:GxxExxY protein
MLIEEQLTEAIIAAAIEVHREMGPGLLESSYRVCLCRELTLRGIEFKTEVSLPVTYKGAKLDAGYRIDLLVADTVIVELKAIEKVLPVHEAQLLTYMKLSGKRVGLLINFNVPLLKQGLTRRVL